jgi:hypothetical protein
MQFIKDFVRKTVLRGLRVLPCADYENENRNFLLRSRFGVAGEFWFRHYAASCKVAGSRPGEWIEFFQFT